jgi:hypothetical protein
MIKEIIVRKFTSAQFLVTLWIVGTYCLIMLCCVYLVIKGKLGIDAFLGIFGAFSTLAALIVKSYFDRDRTPPENKEEKKP